MIAIGVFEALYEQGGSAEHAARVAADIAKRLHRPAGQDDRPGRASLLPRDVVDHFLADGRDVGSPGRRPAIAGVGVTVPARHGGPHRPTVFVVDVASHLPDWEMEPKIAGPIYSYLREIADVDHEDLDIVSLPRSVPLCGPGGKVRAGAGPGTLGARVIDSGGHNAILTAGHVAPTLDVGAFDERLKRIGTVGYSILPQAGDPNVAYPDVAVIRKQPEYRDIGGRPHHRTPGMAKTRSDVVAFGAITRDKVSWVKGVCESYVGENEAQGDWANVLLTVSAISSFGDSGAPVFLAGTNTIVGHVVGGYPGSHTLVQQIDYQLTSCGAALR